MADLIADQTIKLEPSYFNTLESVQKLSAKAYRLYLNTEKPLELALKFKALLSNVSIIGSIPIVKLHTDKPLIVGRIFKHINIEPGTPSAYNVDLPFQLKDEKEFGLFKGAHGYAIFDFVVFGHIKPLAPFFEIVLNLAGSFKILPLGLAENVFHVDQLLYESRNSPSKFTVGDTLTSLPYYGYPQMGLYQDDARVFFLGLFDAQGNFKIKFRDPALETTGERIVVPALVGGNYGREDLQFSAYFPGSTDFLYDELKGGFILGDKYGQTVWTGGLKPISPVPYNSPVIVYNSNGTSTLVVRALGPVARKGPNRSQLQ